MRLRFSRPDQGFNVVLVNPEIPQNTGNIARLCAATGSSLHLVGKLGFSIDEKAVRRAGLDYWHLVSVFQHADLEECIAFIGTGGPSLFTTKNEGCYLDADYRPGGALVFGSESKGLPADVTQAYPASQFGIPTVGDTVRSLNLANAVSVVVYEGLRQMGALNSHSLGS